MSPNKVVIYISLAQEIAIFKRREKVGEPSGCSKMGGSTFPMNYQAILRNIR